MKNQIKYFKCRMGDIIRTMLSYDRSQFVLNVILCSLLSLTSLGVVKKTFYKVSASHNKHSVIKTLAYNSHPDELIDAAVTFTDAPAVDKSNSVEDETSQEYLKENKAKPLGSIQTMYTIKDNVPLYDRTSTDLAISNIVKTLPIASEISIRETTNPYWVDVEYDGYSLYTLKDALSTTKPVVEIPTVETMENANNHIPATFTDKGVYGDIRKSYMDYKCITDSTSPQYKLQRLYGATNNFGIRTVNNRLCIALGSFYTHNVGQYVDLILADDTVLHCIIGDQKKNIDTHNNNSIGNDGGVAEFVVQTSALSPEVRRMGDISYASESFKQPVKMIRVIDYSVSL